jgi:hypothetical protein
MSDTRKDEFWEWLRSGRDPAEPPRLIAGTATSFVDATDIDQRYALAALERLSGEVAMATEGTRNDTLNARAVRAYRVADGCGLERRVVTDTMGEAARRSGLPDAEIAATLRSAENGADKYGPVQRDPSHDILPAYVLDEIGDDGQVTESAQAAQQWVRQRANRIQLERAARELADAESRPKIEYPPVRSLATLLEQPCAPTRFRIAKVAPINARILAAAQQKAGKSTLRDNLARSLADREQFLGRFDVNVAASALVLIDNELSDDMVQDWLRAQNIRNTAAVADVITLRGNVSAFNILDDHCRDTWARRFHDLGCDYLVLDCLRPCLDALGLSEDKDAGRFLVAFDQLLHDAGISDAMVVHHMGHVGERARGDSRLLDWPDAIWRLVRETDEPTSARFFSAYGRDVDVPEGRLSFDPATRHLTYADGSRSDARTEDALNAVIDVLAGAADDGVSGRAIEVALGGDHTQRAIRSAIRLAVARDLVATSPGARGARLHRIANPCAGCGKPLTSDQVSWHLECKPQVAA